LTCKTNVIMNASKISLFTAFAAFFLFAFTFPKDSGTATIDKNYCIVLNGETVHGQYLIDISGLEFTTEKEATKVFGSIMSNLRDFEQLDMTTQTVIMNVHTDRTGPVAWDKTKWDAYFTTYCN
jgi:hypothetical protein